MSLENEFWHGLREIAGHENTTVPMLVEQIDRSRDICNLSSAIRVFVFNYFRAVKCTHETENLPRGGFCARPVFANVGC